MRIGLLSDTHSQLDGALKRHFAACDEVWHAGDIGDLSVTDRLAAFKPLRAVWGNIDNHSARLQFKETEIFTIEGVKVMITHIGGAYGKYPAKVKRMLELERPKLFICGHSHILRVMNDTAIGCLNMNPGAAGDHGFHHVRTVLRFTIANGTIKDLEAIELGKRGSCEPW